MVETVTAHYGWTKPEVTKSASTWGGFLNSDLDSIDALVFANQQGIVPIGSVTMWAGPNAKTPSNWTLCAGQGLDTTVFAKLFAVIGYLYGGSGATFYLPNLLTRFPMGSGDGEHPGGAGGEATHQLVNGELPSHAHPIADVAHNHSINQSAHNHGDPGHSHSVNDIGHSHGSVINPGGQYSLGVAGGTLIGTAGRTTIDGGGITINGATTGIQANTIPISLNASGTGLSATQVLGGNLPHNNLPPYVTINFIIRYA